MTKPAINEIKTAEPVALLKVPFADNADTLQCGLRQSMLSIAYESDNNHGEVLTGTGLGSDYIILKWGKRRAVMAGRDLLAARVRSFDPQAGNELAEFFGGDE